jgi:hypothetical protein
MVTTKAQRHRDTAKISVQIAWKKSFSLQEFFEFFSVGKFKKSPFKGREEILLPFPFRLNKGSAGGFKKSSFLQ